MKYSFLPDSPICKCPKCEEVTVIRYSPKNRNYFVGCQGYPTCKQTFDICLGDLINHLLLSHSYFVSLTNSITENKESIIRGDYLMIDSLENDISDAREHLLLQRKEQKEWPEYRPNSFDFFNLDDLGKDEVFNE